MMKKTLSILMAVVLAACLAAYAQQYIESLKIGGGSGSSGTDLNANGTVQMDGDLVMTEKADHTETPAAGYGQLWTRSDTPNVLVFTDDAGTDTVLGGSGISSGDITGKTTVSAASGDYVLITDATDSNALKKVDVGDFLAGSGDVTKVGTPADGQIGVWTGDGTIEGDSALTFDTTDDTLVIGASGKLGFGAVDVMTDSAGTLTLGNVDALDATTEATIEAAIDTLANLTSIQGQTVTVSGTATISGTNSGDVTLAGTPDYLTLAGQVITRNAVDVTTDITGAVPVANGGTGATTAAGARTALDVDQAGTDNSTDVTLAGTPDYITIAGQVITRAQIDLTADVTGTLPIANGGTGATTLAGASIPTYTSTNTFTNKRITPRVGSTTSSATPTIDTDSYDIYRLTAQAADITSFTTNLSGTPTHGQQLIIEVTGTAARAITWGASFESGAVDLPTTTITTQMLSVGLMYNSGTSKWRCMAAGPLS